MANEAQLKILNRLDALEARVKALESGYVRPKKGISIEVPIGEGVTAQVSAIIDGKQQIIDIVESVSETDETILDEYASENEKMISEYAEPEGEITKETEDEGKSDIAPNQKDQS